jgi:hypothetical protein
MRYYFHLRENGGYVPDEEGIDLPGREVAIHAAVMGARSLLASGAMEGRLPLGSILEVEDEHGCRVTELPFREAVTVDD